MLNKIDITPFDQLTPENQEMINDFLKTEGVKFYKTSNVSKEGIMDMRNAACDELLVQVNTFLIYWLLIMNIKRVEAKLRGRQADNILNRVYVAQPKKRDEVDRPSVIPGNAPQLREEADARPKIRTERDIELELDVCLYDLILLTILYF